MGDVYSSAINAPSGRLAEVLLKRLASTRGKDGMTGDIQARLERLIEAPGSPGKLARIRISADVSFLFERFPDWTKEKVIPIFDWASPDAQDAWEARKYTNYIGSPVLFSLIKAPFLEMFGRLDISAEEVRVYASWLATILIANKTRSDEPYPLEPVEARNALRRVGAKSLSSVGHRLAVEMGNSKPEEKVERWRTVVGPVLQEIWPIDVDIGSNSANDNLFRILISTGDAFLEAADVIIPLMRPEDHKNHLTVISIFSAPSEIYTKYSHKLFEILDIIVNPNAVENIFYLDDVLRRIGENDPRIANSRKFQRLLGRGS
jgi:hypothetical protein